MICEVVRGLIFASRVAQKAEKCAKKSGFACDEMPCFKDRGDDDEEEGRGCDKAPCCRDSDDDDDDDVNEVIDVKTEAVEAEKKEPVKKTVPARKTAPAKRAAPANTTSKKKDKKDDKE